MKTLYEQRKVAFESYKDLDVAIKALQKVCKHKNRTYDGHGHNDDFYTCDDCGYTWSE